MVFLSGDLTVVLRARYPAGRLRTQETGVIRGLRVYSGLFCGHLET